MYGGGGVGGTERNRQTERFILRHWLLRVWGLASSDPAGQPSRLVTGVRADTAAQVQGSLEAKFIRLPGTSVFHLSALLKDY